MWAPYLSLGAAFTSSSSFFLQPLVPKLTEPSEGKKKKKKSESKVATGGSLGVCLITKMSLKTKL